MIILTTGTGRRIECDSVLRSLTFQYLYITTPQLTLSEIDDIFNNPAETEVLSTLERIEQPDGTVQEESRVYRGWTVLEAIRRSPWYDGSRMIWLTRPEEEEAT